MSVWSDARVEALRRLWGTGRSAAAIAAEVGGVNRNQVIGKAHRLGLEGRPSPIVRRPPALAPPSARGCEFPFGDPREADFRFCGAARQAGSAYCPEHHRRCWRKPGEPPR